VAGAGFILASYVVLPIIGGSLFAALRRSQREKLLRDLAREGDAGSDRYLEVLREALDSRFEDVGLHLRYAEALFARGRVKEAAVEARLLIQQDPYHFNGNLLLANAYYSLGLYPECVRVCDDYLAVSGYCFEFSELRQGCQRKEPA
jgi:DNA-binding SARP family transcriptional activator